MHATPSQPTSGVYRGRESRFPRPGRVINTVDVAANELAALVGHCWAEAQVASALAVPPESLAVLRAEGEVLAMLAADGVWVYPVDQFRTGRGQIEVKPDLVPVFRALREHDPWAVAVLLHTPAPELDDRSPIDWVAAGGDSSAVSGLADAVAREWAAGTPA